MMVTPLLLTLALLGQTNIAVPGIQVDCNGPVQLHQGADGTSISAWPAPYVAPQPQYVPPPPQPLPPRAYYAAPVIVYRPDWLANRIGRAVFGPAPFRPVAYY